METITLTFSCILSCAAFLTGCLYLFKRTPQAVSIWKTLLAASVGIHAIGFIIRTADFWAITPIDRYFLPVNTFFGALSFLALVTNLVCLRLAHRHNISVLGVFVLPVSQAAQAAALFFFNADIHPLDDKMHSLLNIIHPLVLMSTYGTLANAFAVAAAFLIQDWQIKSRRPSEFCWQIPSLEVLDRLNSRLMMVAVPLLAVGIILGSLWARGAWGRLWGWDAKEIASLVTFMIYSTNITMRLAFGWRGRWSALMNCLGFASILLTFFLADLASKVHDYL